MGVGGNTKAPVGLASPRTKNHTLGALIRKGRKRMSPAFPRVRTPRDPVQNLHSAHLALTRTASLSDSFGEILGGKTAWGFS